MSDDTEQPKRKYTRRGSAFENDKIDDAAASYINETVENMGIPSDADVEVEVEPVEIESPRLLNEEPVNGSITAKIKKKLGIRKSMELKPWKGHDRWICEYCKWETFDAKRARAHNC